MTLRGRAAVSLAGTMTVEEIDVGAPLRARCWSRSRLYGHCSPARDFPRILGLYARADLLLDEMVTSTYALDDGGAAFDDMLAGDSAKGVLVLE